MSDLLEAAAAALGIPAPLVTRAAEARAAETGTSVDEVLSAWAGGGSVAPAAAPPPEPAEATAPESEEVAEAPAPTATPEPAAPVAPAVSPVPAAATPAPAPTEVTPREAAHVPEVITVPTAGIRERTSSSIPRWLTALMIVVPFVALFALGGGATGECGSNTELRIDVVTGQVVDCDGSEFTGRESAGGGAADFIAMGEQIYTGAAVSGVQCFGCHGATGQGAGTFPALTGVQTTFSACTDHIEWVTLGTGGFQAAGRSTYGDTGKAVGGAGNMPGFAGSLSEEQLAAVTAFERVRFGGADREATLVDCGLAEGENGEDAENGGDEAGEGAEDGGTNEEGGDVSDDADAEATLGRHSS